MKIVLDTNVLLAANTRGVCHELVHIVLQAHEIFLSEFILDETYRHLIDKFKAPPNDAAFFIATMRSYAKMMESAPVPANACRDPDDCIVLGTAVAAGADCLVSGDRDLLTLGSYEGIAILSPRGMYERLRSIPPSTVK